MKTVSVKFLSGIQRYTSADDDTTITKVVYSTHTKYDYFVPKHDHGFNLVGDFVITDTAGVAIIVEEHKEPSSLAAKFYLGRINKDDVRYALGATHDLSVEKKTKEEARRKLNKMLNRDSELILFKLLARDNEEAARLLKILEG